MKYKVGDTAIMQKDSVGQFILKGERVEIIEIGEGRMVGTYCIKKSTDPRTLWVLKSDIEPEPDYRALYEQEKALREAAEDVIAAGLKQTLSTVGHSKEFDHYQQLKQQYNEKEST